MEKPLPDNPTYNTHERQTHPCLCRDSSPQSQQSRDSRTTPQTARPLRPALQTISNPIRTERCRTKSTERTALRLTQTRFFALRFLISIDLYSGRALSCKPVGHKIGRRRRRRRRRKKEKKPLDRPQTERAS